MIAKIVPNSLIPLGFTVLFVSVYPHVAKFIEARINHKLLQVLSSFLISIFGWFLFTIPIVFYQINNLAFGILGYFILTIIAHTLLKKQSNNELSPLIYTKKQKIFRSIFMGLIVFLSVLLTKILNPFWGGLFAMFPAAFSSTVIILHWYYGAEKIFPIIQKSALGSLALFTYAIVSMIFFPKFGYFSFN